MFACDEPWKDFETTTPNYVVVIAASKLYAAILDDHQSPPLGPVLWIHLLQPHHTVGDALHLEVAIGAGQVVQ